MNYYERHLGDYAKATVELSMLEHGAYSLLLDYYYSKEHGIPAAKVYRIAKAATKAERAAVDAVLAEYFHLDDGVWIKDRCEEEIERARVKISAAQENGRKGGRPKKPTGFQGGGNSETQEKPTGKPTGLFPGSKTETQEKALQSPDTRHQTPEEEPPVSPLPPAATPKGQALAEARATPGLDVDAFDRWIAYRAERKPALKPMSLKPAAEQLAKHGQYQADVVQQSIADGYQGIFPLKINGNGHQSQPFNPVKSAGEIEREAIENGISAGKSDREILAEINSEFVSIDDIRRKREEMQHAQH